MTPPSLPSTADSRRALVIGLTGSIAAGKSTVARILAGRGCHVVDVDRLGHAVLERPEVVLEVARVLGSRFLGPDGALDRRALADEVFANPDALAALEAVVHPRVRELLAAHLDRAREETGTVVLDAALLFEGGLDALCDLTVFVDAPLEERRRRTVAERDWEPDELDRRATRQLPIAEKRARADVCLENDADLATLEARVRDVLNRDAPAGAATTGGAAPELEETR